MHNHYEMGRLIYSELTEHHMPLDKFLFLFGSLAPDLCASFLYRRHTRADSDSRFARLLARLYRHGPESGLFSFRLGVMAHYICDFMCFAHTPAFSGGLGGHIRYEKAQTVDTRDLLPFPARKIAGLNASEMARTLGEYIASRERLLGQNAGMSFADIPVAVHVATWAAACVYKSGEQKAHERLAHCNCAELDMRADPSR